jgi:hypothetical protein
MELEMNKFSEVMNKLNNEVIPGSSEETGKRTYFKVPISKFLGEH